MATPTSIVVEVDSAEYSRYEEGKKVITATVTVTGGALYVDEEVLVDLVKARRSRDAVVATSTLTFSGPQNTQQAVVTFDLPDIVDQDLISLVRHGKYFVRATSLSDEDILGESEDFDISIVSVDKLKKDFLFGIDLKATELKEPKFQPSQITGVSIVEVSKGHPAGFFNLTYNYAEDVVSNATAAIGTGANGTVNIEAIDDYHGDTGNSLSVEVVLPLTDGPLSASFSGTSLVVNLAVSGGLPDAGANTSTLIAAAIDALANFSATASGTGVDSISAAEGPTAFTGGESTFIRSVSWNGGPSVQINGPGTIVLRGGLGGPAACLPDAASSEYICIKVSSTALLPTSSISEEIIIDKKTLDDSTLREYIAEAISWLEEVELAVYLEPTNVVTDRDPTTVQFAAGANAPTPIYTDTDYDFIVNPLTYFLPHDGSSWIQIQTQFPQLLRVDSLYGAIANTRIIDIDLEWIEIAQQGGLIQLVPFNQEIAFDFIGLMRANALHNSTELPNFWHFNMIAGLRDAPAVIREVVAKKAAINALAVAGMALRPGVGSLSLSRDGVSESVSYTTSAQYGIYTGIINTYKEWIDDHLPAMKGKYRGPTLRVV